MSTLGIALYASLMPTDRKDTSGFENAYHACGVGMLWNPLFRGKVNDHSKSNPKSRVNCTMFDRCLTVRLPDILLNPSAINPHASQPTSVTAMAKCLWRNRQLIEQMTKRDVVGRYRGSAMGLAWSFFNPVFMLIVYTFVFSVIFKSRWGGAGGDDSKTQFAVLLFVGMIVMSLFSDVLNRAPTLIIANVNYVKKVVFPLEILPVIAVGAALFHSLISLGVLLAAFVLFNGYLQWTIIFVPLVLLPLVILTTGLAWMLASLGVFLRDVGQTIIIITTVLMFLSPVFYPITAVPEHFRPFIMANPLTFIIEQAREVLIWGHLPNWLGLGIYTLVASATAWAGYAWFQRTRKGFADVL